MGNFSPRPRLDEVLGHPWPEQPNIRYMMYQSISDKPYDQVTVQMRNDYFGARSAILGSGVSGDAGSTVGDLCSQFVAYTDKICAAGTYADNVQRTYTPNQRQKLDVDDLDRSVKDQFQKTQADIDAGSQNATALIPQIIDAAWLNVAPVEPYTLRRGMAGPSLESIKHDIIAAFQAGGSSQASAENLAGLLVRQSDPMSEYAFLGGVLDLFLQAAGVNLVSLHRAYASALSAAGRDVPGQKMLDLIAAGTLQQAISSARQFAERALAVARNETATARQEMINAQAGNFPVNYFPGQGKFA